MSDKMSAGNQRYLWKNKGKSQKMLPNLHKTHTHTAKSKNSENPVIPRFPGHFCVFTRGFLLKMLMFYNFPHLNHVFFFSLFCVFLRKTIVIYMKNCKKEQTTFKNKWFFEKKHPEPRDPRIFWDFRFCGGVAPF